MGQCHGKGGPLRWRCFCYWNGETEALFTKTNALFAFSVTNATVNSDQYTLLFEMLPVLVVKLKKTADNERRLHVSVVCCSEKQELNHFSHDSNDAGHLDVILN